MVHIWQNADVAILRCKYLSGYTIVCSGIHEFNECKKGRYSLQTLCWEIKETKVGQEISTVNDVVPFECFDTVSYSVFAFHSNYVT